MRVSIIKKMLASALAVALVTAPVISAQATTDSPKTVESIVKKAAKEAGTTVEEVPRTSSVAGVKTATDGIYLATKVKGTAVTSDVANIAQGYGLASNEKPFAKFSNMDVKKSNLAKASLDAVAASQNATVSEYINIELGKMSAGKYSLLPSNGPAIRIMIGLPTKAVGKKVAMVRVVEGGAVTILPDLDANANTLTFDTTGGAGAYAIIVY